MDFDPRLLSPEAIEAEIARRALERERNKLSTYFPETGPLRRELYAKHCEFFRAGKVHRERMFMAGNRCGKTETGCYEDALHLTGLYPDWWEGRRFTTHIEAWAACLTNSLTRDVLQAKLLGAWNNFGTGLIPHAHIVHWTRKGGLADAVDSVYVRHVTGGVSVLGFKSYAEGPGNFQGTAKHLVHFDEEPDERTYVEANLRTMVVPGDTRGGLMMVTFTPLNGHTAVVDSYLKAEHGTLAA